MSSHLVAFIASALVFFLVDVVWLSTRNQRFYRPQIGGLMRDKPNFAIAGLFYLAYLAGLVILAIMPADSLVQAGLLGALLGFIAYGTYDLTNLSTVKGFTTAVAVVDMAWGTLLSGVTAMAGYWAMTSFAA